MVLPAAPLLVGAVWALQEPWMDKIGKFSSQALCLLPAFVLGAADGASPPPHPSPPHIVISLHLSRDLGFFLEHRTHRMSG